MPKIETILTPALFHLYEQGIEQKNVVVIDILRATTTICVAFENGVKSIVPVDNPQEALQFRKNGFLVAAERSGETVTGFELGNSPQDYTKENIQGKNVALTTTNGTRALRMCKHANRVLIGSFINLEALANVLIKDHKDVMLFCSGWKDKFNLEDTLFAGALAKAMLGSFEPLGDAMFMAMDLYEKAEPNIAQYLQKASHVQRFKTLHVESDLDVCLQMNISDVIPECKEGIISI